MSRYAKKQQNITLRLTTKIQYYDLLAVIPPDVIVLYYPSFLRYPHRIRSHYVPPSSKAEHHIDQLVKLQHRHLDRLQFLRQPQKHECRRQGRRSKNKKPNDVSPMVSLTCIMEEKRLANTICWKWFVRHADKPFECTLLLFLILSNI